MAHLALSVLGELQVAIDGVPVTGFESDKDRALLAYLAVESDRPNRRETLTGLLWPDYPAQAARHNLGQALYKLRLKLNDYMVKPPYFLITRETIQFNRESHYSLDLDQFNAYYSGWEKSESRESGSALPLISQLEEMVSLYRGDFLQHFYPGDSAEFEEWILMKREALHQRVMKTLAFLTDDFEQHADFKTAHRYAARQLELDPWREEAHCQLMRLLALEGQRSAALAQYENCRKVLAKELGVEPSSQTHELYEQIRSGSLKPETEWAALVPSAAIHNLPVPLTPFVGRDQELADLGRLIADPEYRCITLVGPGGIGKTRLALQAASQHRNEFSHGSAFIPLASVGTLDAVIPAIANGIGFAFYGPTDPKIQLLNHLREKQMLLVVDNVEHLLVENAQKGTIADLLIEILQAAGGIKLLVTSREAMNMQGEWPFEVQGLTFPGVEQADRVVEYSAVALFVQRARRARPGFELNAEDISGVVHLCRLVEGLPLAIELAAAWVKVLSPVEIAKEIETSLDFLNAQMRDLPERHRNMRAVFDHSWQRLSTDEQHVLCRLSVFRGGFSRLAADQVAGASLPVLSSLVIRSLLRRSPTGRYDLHELIRQYAALKLAEDTHEQQTVQERHSHYYLSYLEEKGVKLQSHEQKEAVAELVVEMDNIRAAWEWPVAHPPFIIRSRVSTTLWYLFEQLSWFKEGEMTFRKTADALRASMPGLESDAIHLAVLSVMVAHYGYFLLRLGRGEEAYAALAPSAAFLRTSADPISATNSLLCLGIICWGIGRYSEAEKSLRESLQLAREHGEQWYEAMSSEILGIVAIEQGAYNQARKSLSEALAIMRQLGDPSMMAHLLSYLGNTMQVLGESSQAEKLLRESLELAREISYRHTIGIALHGLGRVAYSQARHAEAEAFFSESADLFREMGDIHRLSRTLNYRGLNSLSLNNPEDAKKFFHAGLKLAYEGGWIPAALFALTGLAALSIQGKTSQETLELVLYILQHPASAQETKDLASHLQVELEAKLPKEGIEAAQQHVGSRSLDELVHQFLASG